MFHPIPVGSVYSYIHRVKVALRRENVRAWHEVERDFLECEYRAVRDRQMKELEQEDDLLSKIPVRYVSYSCALFLSHVFTETCGPNFTRSRMNLFVSNAFNVCFKARGL
jgi:hypothetical protein